MRYHLWSSTVTWVIQKPISLCFVCIITMMSYWARWCRKSPASRLFTQPLFRRRSKKTSMLRVTGLCAGKSPGPVNSPRKWPVTRKMSPFDDVIMISMENSHSRISITDREVDTNVSTCHGSTTAMSCAKFVATTVLEAKWEQNEISVKF